MKVEGEAYRRLSSSYIISNVQVGLSVSHYPLVVVSLLCTSTDHSLRGCSGLKCNTS
jgi:hypothetical protein